jgi:ribonuclease P protein component
VRAPSLKAADFQRALGSRPVSRTAHFVLHALPFAGKGTAVVAEPVTHLPARLSTDEAGAPLGAVDDMVDMTLGYCVVAAWRLGLVLPKKQARRSVTRSLIRHQAREALLRHASAVRAQGRFGADVDGWVLRLKAPFDRKQFPSAASTALQVAVRLELDELWSRLAQTASTAPTSSAHPGKPDKRRTPPSVQGGA